MRKPEPARDDVPSKFVRRESGENLVEVQLVKPFDADLFQPVRLGFGVHQPERRSFRREILSWMWFERDDPERRSQTPRLVPRNADYRLVAEVYAIGIPNGDARAAILWPDVLVVPDGPHGLPIAG